MSNQRQDRPKSSRSGLWRWTTKERLLISSDGVSWSRKPMEVEKMSRSVVKVMMVFILVTLLAGCAGSAMPNFYKGHYYMAGGEGCTKWRNLSGDRMMCLDDDGKDTGYIEPMTDQQLQMYMNRRAEPAPTFNYQPQLRNCSTLNGLTHCW